MGIDGLGNLRPMGGAEGQERIQGPSVGRAGQLSETPDGDADDVSTLAPSSLSRYVAAARSASTAHADRAAALKAAVANGTYQVPIDVLAKRLLGNGD